MTDPKSTPKPKEKTHNAGYLLIIAGIFVIVALIFGGFAVAVFGVLMFILGYLVIPIGFSEDRAGWLKAMPDERDSDAS